MVLRRCLQLTLALVVASVLWASAGTAGATENPDYTAPPPTTVITTPPPVAQTKVKTAVSVRPLRTSLAITGSDESGTVVFGTTLVALGAGVLVLRRRRAATL